MTTVPECVPPVRENMDRYVRWLKETNRPVFEVDGTYWRPYQKALVPASLNPQPVNLESRQARELLEKSGALFIRYFTRTYETPTPFWYTLCRGYVFENLPRKLRYQIRRASKDCRIERVDPLWIADHGYACHLAAYSKYRNGQPESRSQFDDMSRGAAGGPFEFWAVFVGDQLAGFGKYFIGDDYVAGAVLKFDPQFLALNPGTAFQHTILNHYVAEQNKTVVIGFRSISHDTNIHDFVLKFGYQRVYCDLQLVYRPMVQACVNLLYPFRSVMDRAPELSTLTENAKALLAQEEIRRTFR